MQKKNCRGGSEQGNRSRTFTATQVVYPDPGLVLALVPVLIS